MLNVLTKKLDDKKKKKGFTLIELIIVIAIIAILAAIAVPKFMNVTEDAKIKADIANAKTIESAITTAMATDKIEFVGNVTEVEVDLAKLLNTLPKGKGTVGDFLAKVDKEGKIEVKIVKKDDKGVVTQTVTVLGETPDAKYANK